MPLTKEEQERLTACISGFRLPRYHELPDVGLYLEQVVRYVNRFVLSSDGALTPSMVSNYVKQKIVPGPSGKTYGPESIACLIFAAWAKPILSLDSIRFLFSVQNDSYSLQTAYDYFCAELENRLLCAFGLRETPEDVSREHSEETFLLRAAVIAITSRIFVEKSIEVRRGREQA